MRTLKRIYYNKLNKHGGNLIFESNLTEKDCLFNKSIFLQDIIIAWQKVAHEDLKPITPKTVIWNNSNIRSGNSPLFYQNWLDKGIKLLKIYLTTDQKHSTHSNSCNTSTTYPQTIL